MRGHPVLSPVVTAAALALAACAATPSGGPLMPGAINAPPPPLAAAGDALIAGTAWSWKETLMRDGERVKPDVPERYTVEFQPGGAVAVRADCNRGAGSYALNGGALSFGPLAVTRAMCPPGSMDAEFLKALGAVSGQHFNGDELVLTLKLDSGSMFFTTTRQ
jgi:heat shock protein HslJ